VNVICPFSLVDKSAAESRIQELEKTLDKEREESKKALNDVRESAASREKSFAERLASLTRDVGGELNISIFAYSFLNFHSM